MRNIVLMCAAGASTSMLVQRMRSAAAEEGFACTIEAHPVNQAADFADSDVILLGPQVRFELNKVKGEVSCPVEAIEMTAYGTMNGKAVLAQARKLMGE